MSNFNTPDPAQQAAWVSFDQAWSVQALISILGAYHTLNTM